MRILKISAAFALMAILIVPAMADDAGDLWLEKKVGNVEFVNGGDVSGLQFDINVGKISEQAYTCGGSLPSEFIASCFLNDGVLRVIVFSMNNAPIPDGTLLSFNQSNKRSLSANTSKLGKGGLHGVIFSDANGKNITPKHLK